MIWIVMLLVGGVLGVVIDRKLLKFKQEEMTIDNATDFLSEKGFYVNLNMPPRR